MCNRVSRDTEQENISLCDHNISSTIIIMNNKDNNEQPSVIVDAAEAPDNDDSIERDEEMTDFGELCRQLQQNEITQCDVPGELCYPRIGIDDQIAVQFARSLMGNTSLKHLYITLLICQLRNMAPGHWVQAFKTRQSRV